MDDDTTSVVDHALSIARAMAEAGIPIFVARPCPSGPFGDRESGSGGQCHRPGHGAGGVEYDLPAGWQKTTPAASAGWIDSWRPGDALAAVGGWAADFLDEDPRNGGDASVGELHAAGAWPVVFGEASTKSGGRHYVVSAMRERKVTGLLPGLDYQGGDETGQGRGFVWIAPTIGLSKAHTDESGRPVARPYAWTQEPDLEWLSDFGRDARGASLDGSTDGLRQRLAGHRAKRTKRIEKAREREGSKARDFTPAQMDHFLAPADAAVRSAAIGEIEERANAYACMLSHFVPALLTAEQAYDRLTDALGETAYDPTHPASSWEADKFIAVIADIGGRAPGDWHAVRGTDPATHAEQIEQAVAAVDPSGDEVTALLAEMLPPSVLRERKSPRYLIKGLLTMDSTPWLIGGPGSKKSFVALDMAAHVALGKPWQGRRVNKGIAILIMGEGAGSIGKRIKAWETKHGPMPDDALRVLPRPVQAGDPKAWAVLIRACERLRAALDPELGMFVVVDTQARATLGLDENSAQEMGVYVDAVTALKEVTGGCVMSVHHTTKAGQGTRGSGALDGAQDTRLLMESKSGTLEGKLHSRKQKDLEEGDPVELRFEKVTVGVDEDGEEITSLTLLPADAWRSALFDDDSAARVAQEQERIVNPFSLRIEPESWTYEVTDSRASLQRWLLQALKDTVAERGLTQAEWRRVVEEKQGKLAPSTWARAFQVVTDSAGRCAEIVVKVHGADRWTVDHVALTDS